MELLPALRKSPALPQQFQRECPSTAVVDTPLINDLYTQLRDIQAARLHRSYDRRAHWHILSDTQFHIQRSVKVRYMIPKAFTDRYLGNSTYAGATAAFMANLVLIAYVIVAFKDDESERIEADEKAKKGQ